MPDGNERTRKEWTLFLILASLLFLAPLFLGPLYETFRNRNVYLLDETPCFDGASPDAGQLGMTEKPASYRVLEWKRVPYLPREFNNGHWFPAEYVLNFYRIRMEDGKEVWASPDLLVIDGKTEVFTFTQERHLPVAVSSLLGLLLTFVFGSRILRKPFAHGGRGSAGGFVLTMYLIVFLKQFFLAAWLYLGNSVQIRLTDERAYFRIACELFHGTTEAWNYTVGYPLLISPVLSLTGISEAGMQKAGELLSACNGYVIMPLCTVMLGIILYHFSASLRRTFYILCGLSLIPFVIFPYENFPRNFFFIWIDLPSLFLSYKTYYTLIWSGCNALSDPASNFFILLCILLGIFRARGTWRMMFLSAVFAFACLIRINNIFFAPLIAFLFWESNKDIFQEKRFTVFWDAVFCLAAFLIVFLIQFLVNLRDFSSPFIWPYALHDTASQGFQLKTLLSGGMTYFVKCNLLLFSFGIAAMIFMKEKKSRILFILWTFPLTLFFSGYVCFAASPIRFILPALFGFAAAIGCGEFWNVTWNRRTLAGAAGLLLLMILAYNPYFHVFISTRLYHSMSNAAHMDAWFLIRMAALGICLAATLLAIRRKISVPVCCWIAAFSLFFIGSGELLWGLSLLLLVYGVWLFSKDVCNALLFRSAKH